MRRKILLGFLISAAGLVMIVLTTVAVTYFGAAQETRSVVRLAEEYERSGLRVADLPPPWLEALIKVEDPAFFDHSGVDVRSPGAGWTTITQGLVKLNYDGPMQGLWGKPRQSIIALALDRALDKESQLTLFLNTAYLGESEGGPIRGFPDAARRYFGVGAFDLTQEQFLELVAALVAPGQMDPVGHPEANRERVRRIQALLAGECAPSGWRDVYLSGCSGSR